MTERISDRLSGNEKGVLKAFRKGGKFTKTEIGSAVDLLKKQSEIPPYFSGEDLGHALDTLEEKGVLKREVVWSITEEAKKDLEAKANARRLPVVARESLLPAHIPTKASPVEKRVDPSLKIVQTPKPKTIETIRPEPSAEVKEEPKRESELKKIGHKVDDMVKEMRARKRNEVLLLSDEGKKWFFLINGSIREVDATGHAKVLSIREVLGEPFLERKLESLFQAALYKLTR